MTTGAIRLTLKITGILLCLFAPGAQAAGPAIGQISYVHGTVTLQSLNADDVHLVATDEKLATGEFIRTGPGSFAIVRLNDGSLITLRPQTTFGVEQFVSLKKAGTRVVLRLFQGGLRVVAASASRDKPGSYRLLTPVSELSIEGAVFDARLCLDDCEEENRKIKTIYDKQLDATVARPLYVYGSLVARSASGNSRVLAAGSAIFEGDTLQTRSGSYAVLVFRDESRISLQANTVFRIDAMKYDSESEDDSASRFSLLRGGLRTLTGLQYPQKYIMHTAINDITIAGTGYDLICTGPCEARAETGLKPLRLKQGDGLYAHVWQGAISLGDLVLPAGKAGYQSGRESPPLALSTVPAFLRKNKVPRPDRVDIDDTGLFDRIEKTAAPHGLYVSVSSGQVRVKTKIDLVAELHRGEASYTDALGRQVKKLYRTPIFQRFDRYPMPNSPDPGVSSLSSSIIGGSSGTVCIIR